MLKAEKRYAKNPMQRWIMNEPIRQIMYAVKKYWQIAISAEKNHIDSTHTLAQIKQRLPAQYIRQIQVYHDNPKEGFKKIKKDLEQEKKSRIIDIQDEEAADITMTARRAENLSIINIEQQRKRAKQTESLFAGLCNQFEPPHSQGLRSVIIPVEDPVQGAHHVTISDRQEVETKIIQRNIEHFGQAEGTPFTKPTITDALGYTGVSKKATRIINGKDVDSFIEDLGSGERKILRQLNDGENSESINIHITFDEFKAGFRKWKEATSTSPSGRHLGQYIALLKGEVLKIRQSPIQIKTGP